MPKCSQEKRKVDSSVKPKKRAEAWENQWKIMVKPCENDDQWINGHRNSGFILIEHGNYGLIWAYTIG